MNSITYYMSPKFKELFLCIYMENFFFNLVGFFQSHASSSTVVLHLNPSSTVSSPTMEKVSYFSLTTIPFTSILGSIPSCPQESSSISFFLFSLTFQLLNSFLPFLLNIEIFSILTHLKWGKKQHLSFPLQIYFRIIPTSIL